MQVCENCRYHTFMVNDNKEAVSADALICRRYPPTIMMVPMPPTISNPQGGGIGFNSFYPSVGLKNWCGEWASLDKKNSAEINHNIAEINHDIDRNIAV